jgi:hypothetical protein
MIIGILYICTDKYSVYWKDFYLTANKNLFPGIEKKYFVFTDSNEIFGENADKNITKIKIEHRKWPYNTLLRFQIFDSNKTLFSNCDYLFFFNANTLFLDTIKTEELLPNKDEQFLVALCNQDYYAYKNSDEFTYDRNHLSTAYIPFGKGHCYYRGGLNGGRTNEYLELIKICKDNINIDLQHDIIAAWHDESYLNKYLFEKNIKVVYTKYGKAEEWKTPKNAKIIFLDKRKAFGKREINKFKKINNSYSLKRFLKKMLKKL